MIPVVTADDWLCLLLAIATPIGVYRSIKKLDQRLPALSARDVLHREGADMGKQGERL